MIVVWNYMQKRIPGSEKGAFYMQNSLHRSGTRYIIDAVNPITNGGSYENFKGCDYWTRKKRT